MKYPVGDEKLQSDARLMRRVAAGDKQAKRELVKALWCRVNRMVRYMCPFGDEVEDLTQEVMLQILKSAEKYKADGCLEAWADVVTTRTIVRRIKRTRRRHQTFVMDHTNAYETTRAFGSNVETDVVARARRERVMGLLAHLPANQRAAVVLKLVLGHSVKEVAEMMGKRGEEVRYLLRKARGRLFQRAIKDRTLQELLLWRDP